jgi:hypothetical protein
MKVYLKSVDIGSYYDVTLDTQSVRLAKIALLPRSKLEILHTEYF